MNGLIFGEFSEALNVLLLLFIFGTHYNRFVENLGHKAEGWTWALVVCGVAVTQVGVGALDILMDWNALWISLIAYAASGSPMIYGGIRRHFEAIERTRKAAQE